MLAAGHCLELSRSSLNYTDSWYTARSRCCATTDVASVSTLSLMWLPHAPLPGDQQKHWHQETSGSPGVGAFKLAANAYYELA